MERNLISLDEAAEYLCISPHTLRAWLAQGKLPYVKLVGRVLFCKQDLETFIERCMIRPAGNLVDRREGN